MLSYWKFSPAEWLMDPAIASLDYEAQGVYITLLCRMWASDRNGRIGVPDDDAWLARVLRLPIERWREIRAVLVDGPGALLRLEAGLLVSDRLQAQWDAAMEKSRQAQEAGGKRWAAAPPEAASTRSGDRDQQKALRDVADAQRPLSDRSASAKRTVSHPEIEIKTKTKTETEGVPDKANALSSSSPVRADDPSPPFRQPADEEVAPGLPAPLVGVELEPVSAMQVLAAWNEICADVLPRARVLTDQRRQRIQARCRAQPGRDERWWRRYFARIRASPFLVGRNDRGWQADLDWAVRSEQVVARVLEGRYDVGARNGVGVAGGDGRSDEPRGYAGLRQLLAHEAARGGERG